MRRPAVCMALDTRQFPNLLQIRIACTQVHLRIAFTQAHRACYWIYRYLVAANMSASLSLLSNASKMDDQ